MKRREVVIVEKYSDREFKVNEEVWRRYRVKLR